MSHKDPVIKDLVDALRKAEAMLRHLWEYPGQAGAEALRNGEFGDALAESQKAIVQYDAREAARLARLNAEAEAVMPASKRKPGPGLAL